MATEKIINTRIQLKYDTLANWNTNSSLVLKKGEVGICAIPISDPQLKVAQETPPAIMFKVGDGETTFGKLPWASALAADVYAWAKKAAPDVADFGDIIDAAREGLISADSVVKTLNELKGDVTIEAATGETRITVAKNEQKITFALNLTAAEENALKSGITSAKVTQYDGYEAKITAAQDKADAALPQATFDTFKEQNTKDIAAAKKAGDDAQATANSKYALPEGGVPKTDLAEAVQGSLGKADSAIQSVSLAGGTANGTLKLTVDGTAGDDIKVTGLGDLAYKSSLTKADVGLGNIENKTLDTNVTADSGNYITSGAVKSYVDGAIGAVSQFKYEVVTALGTASADTMGKIYLLAHTHGTQDSYDEFITIEKDGIYSWEKIGNTDIDLAQYVNGISGTTDNGVVTNITKNGNTITVTSKSLETADPAVEAGADIAFIKSVSQAADGKITAHKQNVPTATKTQLGLVKGGTTSGKVYGVDIADDGAMTVSVPWENTQNANTWRPISLGGTPYKTEGTSSGKLNLVGGENVDISIANANTENEGVQITAKNQTVKAAGVSFGANDMVEFAAGSGLKVSADAVNKSVTYSIDNYDKTNNPNGVVFVFNCGSSTELVD